MNVSGNEFLQVFRRRTLVSICKPTAWFCDQFAVSLGNQCSSFKTGVMCSLFRVSCPQHFFLCMDAASVTSFPTTVETLSWKVYIGNFAPASSPSNLIPLVMVGHYYFCGVSKSDWRRANTGTPLIHFPVPNKPFEVYVGFTPRKNPSLSSTSRDISSPTNPIQQQFSQT